MNAGALMLAIGTVAVLASSGSGSRVSGSRRLSDLDVSSSWANRQIALRVLGFYTARVDGKVGPATRSAVAAFQRSVGIDDNGKWTRATDREMRKALSRYIIEDGGFAWGQYKPGSSEFRALFREAAARAGIPLSWADSEGLKQIVRRESGGWVGIPNYTYGKPPKADWPKIWQELVNGELSAKPTWSPYQGKKLVSSATGLGQLTLSNVDAYYPAWRYGIGNALQEAMGTMLRIRKWYGDPDRAFDCYGVRCDNPPCPTKYGTAPCYREKGFTEGY